MKKIIISRKELIDYYIFELDNALNQIEFSSIRGAMRKELSSNEFILVMSQIKKGG